MKLINYMLWQQEQKDLVKIEFFTHMFLKMQ